MNTQTKKEPGQGEINFGRAEGETLLLKLVGDWRLGTPLPSADEVRKQIETTRAKHLAFDAAELKNWDSSLLTFLIKVSNECAQGKIEIDNRGLPEGAKRLLKLASAVPERKGARKELKKEFFLSRVGGNVLASWHSSLDMLNFLGEATLSFLRLLKGKASFRRSDLVLLLQNCGADALPIVSLISFLIGLILAFVGAIQLMMFGAQIYVADIVAIGMVRIMGAIMTGIIVAGRTGAAFAAQIGTMQVNEEIDALHTLGISPMDFLVLPRMLALIVMMPLLCVYADIMGILGGLVVAVGMLDIGVTQYLHRTQEALNLTHFWIGLFHSAVFGVLVALSGCLRGMECGRSASAVGESATSAVVTSIVAIIVATAIITFVCQVLGI